MTRLLILALLLAGCGGAPPAPHPPAHPTRIVSLDFCADQFVLKLADRDQIAAVSPDAAKPFSFMRAAAAGVAQTRANAEDVIALDPDLVVLAYGGGPDAERLFARAGIPVADVAYAGDFAAARANIRRMAAALGHRERGDRLIAEMDARLAAAARAPGAHTALYLTPGGVTTGDGSLVHDMLRAAGFANYVQAPGWRPIPLEDLARRSPDLIAAASFGRRSDRADLWSSARHPVAQRLMRERPVVALEGAWTACGGWFLAEAVEALARGHDALAAP